MDLNSQLAELLPDVAEGGDLRADLVLAESELLDLALQGADPLSVGDRQIARRSLLSVKTPAAHLAESRRLLQSSLAACLICRPPRSIAPLRLLAWRERSSSCSPTSSASMSRP